MLVIGMLEFGRAVMVQQVLTNASREGARYAVLDGSTVAATKQKVVDYGTSASIPITTNDITVNPDPTTAGYGTPVTVSVAVPFSRVSWVPLPNIPFANVNLKTVTLSASTVMRRETVQ